MLSTYQGCPVANFLFAELQLCAPTEFKRVEKGEPLPFLVQLPKVAEEKGDEVTDICGRDGHTDRTLCF
jgi:hypothetical protein